MKINMQKLDKLKEKFQNMHKKAEDYKKDLHKAFTEHLPSLPQKEAGLFQDKLKKQIKNAAQQSQSKHLT